MTPRYRIPFFQPLPPAHLVRPRQDLSRTFPFSQPRSQYYYLARNAIWYGIDALRLAPGDEILMPAYHHGVDLEVLLAKGLKPRFFRVDESARIDLEDMERAWSPRVKALYVIHYFGFPQPIVELKNFAKARGIALIEDCALSLLSSAPQGPLGSFGDIGVFCLYKTLPVPHGGILALNRDGLHSPPVPDRPDALSTASHIANLLIANAGLGVAVVGPRLARWGKSLARATKHAMGAATLPIDTNELDTSVIPLGMAGSARYLMRRSRPAEIVRIRRRNFEHLESLLGGPGKARPLFRDLPEGVCPLSLPLLVRDKERVHEELLAEGVGNVNFWSRTNPLVPRDAFPEVRFLRQHVLEIPVHQGLEPRHIEFIAECVARRAAW